MHDEFVCSFMLNYALKLMICLGDTNGCVEPCGVGGRHGGVSVVVGASLSVGGAIQHLKVGN